MALITNEKIHTLTLTPEQIGHAISLYLEQKRVCTLKIDFMVTTEMNDSSNPSPTGKLVGAVVTFID